MSRITVYEEEKFFCVARVDELQSADRKGANPLTLIRYGIQEYPDYFRPALQNYRDIPLGSMLTVVDNVPEARMSDVSRAFAKALLTFTKDFLLELQS